VAGDHHLRPARRATRHHRLQHLGPPRRKPAARARGAVRRRPAGDSGRRQLPSRRCRPGTRPGSRWPRRRSRCPHALTQARGSTGMWPPRMPNASSEMSPSALAGNGRYARAFPCRPDHSQPRLLGRASVGLGPVLIWASPCVRTGRWAVPAGSVRDADLRGILRRANRYGKLRRRLAAPAGRAQADNG
jgi:hypothetical protein